MSQRSKIMYRVHKARARLSADMSEEEKREIIFVSYWAEATAACPQYMREGMPMNGVIDRLNACAGTKRMRQ